MHAIMHKFAASETFHNDLDTFIDFIAMVN